MVLHIILTSNFSPWSAYSGGGQRSTHNLATALSEGGHHVEVVYTKSPFEHVAVPSNLAYTLHWATLPSMRSKRASWLRNFTVFSVRQKVNSLLTDQTIVHSNGEEGALIGTLKPRKKIYFVCTPRYPQIPAEIINPSASLTHSFFRFKNTKYYLLASALQHADVCAPTSRFALKMLKKHYNFNQSKQTIIPNGVDKSFLDAKPKLTFKGPLIFFGRLAYSKGVDTLIEALSLINISDLQAVIIGRGNLKPQLQRQACQLGIKNKIQFKGWMNQGELITTLEAASLAVLPSREESFGNTMAEAMATGTPVISTTAGSIPEVVIDGKTGLLVPPDDPVALSKAIENLLHNESFAQTISENGQRHVQNNFTWQAVAQMYEKEYKKLLE